MRNISFSMTTEQFLDGSKDVTRRWGWSFLKPGDRLRAVKKAMGLKKGEAVEVLGIIEVVSVRREPLNAITREDCVREGFPHFEPADFVSFLLGHYKGRMTPESAINRIEFKRIQNG